MSGLGVATMTAIRIKELSTGVFVRFARRLSKIEFLRRNRRALVICVSVWLVVNIAGFFIYRAAAGRANDALYQRGLSAAENLAKESGPFVLGKDILALNLAIKELEKLNDLKFGAVLDHENTILTHTDSEMVNRKFASPKSQKTIGSVNDTAILAATAPDKSETIAFARNITYAGVKIGTVYIALSGTHLYEALARLKFIYIAGVLLAAVLLVVILLWVDHKAKARALALKQELESTNRIGPYLLQKKVATGGMAELFLSDYVREDGFRRRVAVKRILPHLAENTDFIKMFTREARLAALLHHPNIVQIFDFGKIGNAHFIAMEYIDGKDLGEILSALKQGLPIEHTIYIISEVCKGLDYSHSKRDDKTDEPLNIVHRDISPQNLLISYQGEVKISDFGISKARSEPSFTQAGVIKGKLSYLSTEQALGEPIDQRADIYALGLVFYETLTGERVYKFGTDIEAISAIPKMEIEPLINARPEVPEELNRIVMRCLEKNKDARYHSASELHTDLVALKRGLKIAFDASDLASFMQKNFGKGGN